MRIRPILQITLGLVVLTSAMLLIIDLLLGVFADPDTRLLRVREAFAEGAATQVTAWVERGDTRALPLALERIRQHDTSIRSLAIRRADQSVLAQAGDHKRAWAEREASRSPMWILVPLTKGSELWGSFEVVYAADEASAIGHLLDHPLWITLLIVATLGGLMYWQYIRRALIHLDPKAVIPERVTLAFDIMTEGVVVLDRRSRVLLANKAFRVLSGGDAATDLVGKELSQLPWLAAGLPSDASEYPWTQAMQSGEPVIDYAIRVAPAAGSNRRLLVHCAPITDARGSVRGCVATFDDFTALHLANERLSSALAELYASRDEIAEKNVELERLASHDSLTGCLTRRAFFERMAQARQDARRNSKPLSCLALDIDRFKSVNDRFGHVVGDRVVEIVGHTLSASVRAVDVVGRYGGDEFFVGMPGCDLEGGVAIAEKLRIAIEERCQAGLTDVPGLHITVSIGVATSQGGEGTLADLIEQADKALYDAKANGRNRVAVGGRAPIEVVPS
jgi:diguanylate cyclase (GGDEF)-like protein/PAS domain S-box-containing protein